jgi:ABC-type lipoprotein export system ATPase subunit
MRNGGWAPESKIFGKSNEASGGQQQRMAFARALVSEYSILFCDEPTGNLDPETADMLMNYLRTEITRKGDATAIIVSHDMKLATKYGDRIIKIFKKHRDGQTDDYYGVIDSESLFSRHNGQWTHQGHAVASDAMIDKLITMDR